MKKLFYISVVIVVLLFMAGGCETLRPPDDPEKIAPETDEVPEREVRKKVEKEIYHIDPEILLTPTTSRSELEKTMGKPENVDVNEIENEHHPDITDTVYTYYYPGVRFVIYQAGYDNREFLLLASITGDNYRVGKYEPKLTVGATIEEVLTYFGENGVWDEDTLFFYPAMDEGPLPAGMVYSFQFDNSRVVKIDIQAEYF